MKPPMLHERMALSLAGDYVVAGAVIGVILWICVVLWNLPEATL